MSKKILITGATGFVGSRLAARLVKHNYDVHVTVRNNSNLWRLNEIKDKLHLHELDLLNQEKIKSLIKQIKPNILFHLACYGGLPHEQDALLTLNTNYLATYYLLDACKQIQLEKFIYVGSSSEYGDQTEAMNENHQERPKSFYGISKLAASHLTRLYGEEKLFPTSTLRIFSPFGPYDDLNRLIPIAINACLQQRPLKLGSGTQVRDFIYIDDLINAFVLAMQKTDGRGEIINLGSGKQHTINDVINIILDICDYPIKPEWHVIADRNNEPKNWLANINKAQKLLGWSPKTSLREGLTDTIAWTTERNKATL